MIIRRAVITGKESKYKDVSDLKGTKMGISRLGRSVRVYLLIFHKHSLKLWCDSGSQTMAFVMALQQGWRTDDLDFQSSYDSERVWPFLQSSKYLILFSIVNNDIRGLIDSVNDGSTSAFMWEWFTTKPWLDTGEVRFVRKPSVDLLHSMLHDNPVYIDRLCPNAMAVLVDRSSPFSHPCTSRKPKRIFKDLE